MLYVSDMTCIYQYMRLCYRHIKLTHMDSVWPCVFSRAEFVGLQEEVTRKHGDVGTYEKINPERVFHKHTQQLFRSVDLEVQDFIPNRDETQTKHSPRQERISTSSVSHSHAALPLRHTGFWNQQLNSKIKSEVWIQNLLQMMELQWRTHRPHHITLEHLMCHRLRTQWTVL